MFTIQLFKHKDSYLNNHLSIVLKTGCPWPNHRCVVERRVAISPDTSVEILMPKRFLCREVVEIWDVSNRTPREGGISDMEFRQSIIDSITNTGSGTQTFFHKSQPRHWSLGPKKLLFPKVGLQIENTEWSQVSYLLQFPSKDGWITKQ